MSIVKKGTADASYQGDRRQQGETSTGTDGNPPSFDPPQGIIFPSHFGISARQGPDDSMSNTRDELFQRSKVKQGGNEAHFEVAAVEPSGDKVHESSDVLALQRILRVLQVGDDVPADGYLLLRVGCVEQRDELVDARHVLFFTLSSFGHNEDGQDGPRRKNSGSGPIPPPKSIKSILQRFTRTNHVFYHAVHARPTLPSSTVAVNEGEDVTTALKTAIGMRSSGGDTVVRSPSQRRRSGAA